VSPMSDRQSGMHEGRPIFVKVDRKGDGAPEDPHTRTVQSYDLLGRNITKMED
jgi:hypothetical protein